MPDIESPGLGTVFVDEIQRAIENISEFPESAPLIRGRIRKRIIIKFPYSLCQSFTEFFVFTKELSQSWQIPASGSKRAVKMIGWRLGRYVARG
ncbi:MAG: hypothetical protein V1736_02935 [Pseudomonadota bacterium]